MSIFRNPLCTKITRRAREFLRENSSKEVSDIARRVYHLVSYCLNAINKYFPHLCETLEDPCYAGNRQNSDDHDEHKQASASAGRRHTGTTHPEKEALERESENFLCKRRAFPWSSARRGGHAEAMLGRPRGRQRLLFHLSARRLNLQHLPRVAGNDLVFRVAGDHLDGDVFQAREE